MAILVGTSGWSYPSGGGTWNGVFYPARRPAGFDELAWYAGHFDTVEVNSTFYRQPDPAMTSRWIERTPSSFRFAVKLFQKFTHPDMYIEKYGAADWDVTLGDLDAFRTGIDPIVSANRLVALLLQFPPGFQAGEETRDYLDWLLRALRGYPTAVELRHRSWSDEADATRAVLDTHGASWVLIDEPKFRTSIRQALPDSSSTAGERLCYIRLHGRNAAQWWTHDRAEDRYNYLYSPEELSVFADAAREVEAAGRPVVMYLNNHFSAKAAANAAILRHQLGQDVPGIYPRAMVERYPDLDGIVQTDGLPL